MTFIFSSLWNMLHSDTPNVEIITEDCRIWEKSTVSHSPKFCRFSLRGNTIFHRMLFSVHITQHNGNYRMILFRWYELCIGILLCWHANDVMFFFFFFFFWGGGYQAHFGTQKNYATGTKISSKPLLYDTVEHNLGYDACKIVKRPWFVSNKNDTQLF